MISRKSGEGEMVSVAARSSADAADISEGDTQTNLSHAFLTEPKYVQSVSSRDSRFAELFIFPEVEEALRQARKMEMMGHMAAGVAHDFNNMLHGVMGALDLMRTRVGEGRMGELSDLLQTARCLSDGLLLSLIAYLLFGAHDQRSGSGFV
jgi:signal transduction histidine kinase